MYARRQKRCCRCEEDITIEEMEEILKTQENCIVLDVRSPQEYEEAHVVRKHKYTCI